MKKPTEARLKSNAESLFFECIEKYYLGLWVGKDGIRPLSCRVEDIKDVKFTTKLNDVWKFVGILNYNRGIWYKSTHKISPLTKLI